MEEENFILVSLDDDKSKEISEVLGSRTCKKIINYLSNNKEASEKDLSLNLKIPINTVEYNLKKLISSGFVQKRKNFFWSAKGKKILMYELSKKSVVISHKKSNIEKMKSIVPAFILTGAATFAVWAFQRIVSVSQNLSRTASSMDYATEEFAGQMAMPTAEKGIEIIESIPEAINLSTETPVWAWFLAGALLAIVIISLANWRKL